MTAPGAALAGVGLDVFLAESHVLRAVDFQVAPGETVSLLGRNGVGKTTLLRTLAGLVTPRHGRILLNGEDVSQSPPWERSRTGLAFVPEDRGIFPNLTVEENLTFARPNLSTGAPRRWTRADIDDLFPRLAERRTHWGHQLSGGEQKMLAIARALLANPSVLLLDEATEGLAPRVRDEIWATVRIVRAAGVATVLVDRNLDDLFALADRHVVLARGAVVFDGTGAALQADPAFVRRHLGL